MSRQRDAAWNGENISVEPLAAGERYKMPEREGTCFFALCGNNAAEKQGDSLGSYLKNIFVVEQTLPVLECESF